MLALRKETLSLSSIALALTLAHGVALTARWAWDESAGHGPAPIRVEVANYGGQARASSAPRSFRPRPVAPTRSAPAAAAATEDTEPVVGSAAGNGFGEGVGTGIGTGVASSGGGDSREMYLQELRARIDDMKRYPVQARRLGQSGTVLVSFTVSPDGRIHEPHVSGPCPYRHLNESALNAVASIRTFRPLPVELAEQGPLTVNVPIRYSISQ
jgi:protein TonB